MTPNFPEPKELYPLGSAMNDAIYAYNEARSACIRAYEESRPLRELKVEEVAQEMFEICCYPDPTTWQDLPEPEKSVWRTRASIFCDSFEVPEVTEEEIGKALYDSDALYHNGKKKTNIIPFEELDKNTMEWHRYNMLAQSLLDMMNKK